MQPTERNGAWSEATASRYGGLGGGSGWKWRRFGTKCVSRPKSSSSDNSLLLGLLKKIVNGCKFVNVPPFDVSWQNTKEYWSIVSPLHINLQVASFQRCKHVLTCQITGMHPLQVVVPLCNVLYSTHSIHFSTADQNLYFKLTMSGNKCKAVAMKLIQLYTSRYCTVILKMFSLFVVFVFYVLFKPIIVQYYTSHVVRVVNNLPANAVDVRDMGLIARSERSPGGGNGYPCQYSCLENSTDRGAWQGTVHGASKSQTRLSSWAHCIAYCVSRVPRPTLLDLQRSWTYKRALGMELVCK